MAKISNSPVVCFFILIALIYGNIASIANEQVGVYELKRGNLSLNVTNYGATLLSFVLPDKNGKLGDVVLGFESLDSYKNDSTYFGAIVGRVANRIGGAQFSLNGVEYKLPANDNGKNTLHGGTKGFSDVIWTVRSYKKNSRIILTYNSVDGEQGFPGDLLVSVTYKFVRANVIAIVMKAKPLNKATPVNLASHTYWNLGGQNSGNILSHEIQLFASNITPVDSELIPTGEIVPVEGTPYDFLQSAQIGSKITGIPGGYDINYVVDNRDNMYFKKVAKVADGKSGRMMELWSNKPGVQFYTSNMLDDVKGKGGYVYNKYAALCLETQGFPDSVNHPNFPSQIVNPGDVYEHIMIYKFTTKYLENDTL